MSTRRVSGLIVIVMFEIVGHLCICPYLWIVYRLGCAVKRARFVSRFTKR